MAEPIGKGKVDQRNIDAILNPARVGEKAAKLEKKYNAALKKHGGDSEKVPKKGSSRKMVIKGGGDN
jgi:hypothetical protein